MVELNKEEIIKSIEKDLESLVKRSKIEILIKKGIFCFLAVGIIIISMGFKIEGITLTTLIGFTIALDISIQLKSNSLLESKIKLNEHKLKMISKED